MSIPVAEAQVGSMENLAAEAKKIPATTTAPTVPIPLKSASRWHPTPLFWVILAVVAVAALIGIGSEGFGGFLVVVGAVGLGTAIYAAARRRPSWLNLPPGMGVRAIAIAASALILVLGSFAATPADTTPTASHTTRENFASEQPQAQRPTPTPTLTPTPTPTPVATLADYSGGSIVSAQSALSAVGIVVSLKTSTGQASPADWTGWSVVSESPAAGVPLFAGATVTFVMAPPAPTPVLVAPQPVTQPVAPAQPATPGNGATALCNDGTYSYAAHHQGACSHHGGVAVFYR